MDLAKIIPPDTPAMTPPNGVASNFDHPHGNARVIFATSVLSVVMTTILVWTRLYTRYFIIKAHGWDDYTSFIAWAGLMGYLTISIILVANGAGPHQWDIRLLHFIALSKVAYIMEIYYSPLIFITKLSILIQLRRIFVPHIRDKTYWCIHSLIWVNFLFYTADTMVVIMKCLPQARIWNPTIEGHCINHPAALISSAVINVVSDFLILILPIVKVWQLQMSRKRRIGVCVIFATGGFACLSSIFRLVNHTRFLYTEDAAYALSLAGLWSYAEITSGIVCGCLPALRIFFYFCTSMIRKALNKKSHEQIQKPSQVLRPNAHENSDFKKFTPAGLDDEYLESQDDTCSTNL